MTAPTESAPISAPTEPRRDWDDDRYWGAKYDNDEPGEDS